MQQGAAVACLSLSPSLAQSLHDSGSERPTLVTVLASCCGGSNCVNFPATKICQECGTDRDLLTGIWYLLSGICYLLSTLVHCRPLNADDMKIIWSASAPPLSASVSERCKCRVCSQQHREDVQLKVSGRVSGRGSGSMGSWLYLALISVSCWNSLTAFDTLKCSYPCRQHGRQGPLSSSLLHAPSAPNSNIRNYASLCDDDGRWTGDIALRDLLMSL